MHLIKEAKKKIASTISQEKMGLSHYMASSMLEKEKYRIMTSMIMWKIISENLWPTRSPISLSASDYIDISN